MSTALQHRESLAAWMGGAGQRAPAWDCVMAVAQPGGRAHTWSCHGGWLSRRCKEGICGTLPVRSTQLLAFCHHQKTQPTPSPCCTRVAPRDARRLVPRVPASSALDVASACACASPVRVGWCWLPPPSSSLVGACPTYCPPPAGPRLGHAPSAVSPRVASANPDASLPARPLVASVSLLPMTHWSLQ